MIFTRFLLNAVVVANVGIIIIIIIEIVICLKTSNSSIILLKRTIKRFKTRNSEEVGAFKDGARDCFMINLSMPLELKITIPFILINVQDC